MKIILKQATCAGDTDIPAGEYWVSISGEGRFINLTGGGKDYKVPAIRRSSKVPVRRTDVNFFASSGTSWTIIVKTPPAFEWMGTLNLARKKTKSKPSSG